jgi:hypothetical protein
MIHTNVRNGTQMQQKFRAKYQAVALTGLLAIHSTNNQAAGFVPDHSGGSVPDFHRFPYYAQTGPPPGHMDIY